MYANPTGWIHAKPKGTHTNTDEARRKWKFTRGDEKIKKAQYVPFATILLGKDYGY
jgi:hypothetical protein